ncbi:hypothetical protein A7J71_20655 [Achromobacter insolitus]|nr:hypothetical protein A7J71_20655 [Achromobacter insolitus]OCZ52932.1 hypothetical protein A7P22_16195 [Achromobacter insolitus]
MLLQSKRGSLLVYTDSHGVIIFNSFSSPKGNSAELLAQSIADQKQRDPSLEVVRTYKTHFAGTPADVADITMKAKGREVYMATALGVVKGAAIMIHVVGAKNDRDRIASRAQAVFASLSVSP